MRYTKAILVSSFLAVTLILFDREQKADEAGHGTRQPSIAIKNRTWGKEPVVYRIFPRSFKDGTDGLDRIISKPDYIKRSQHQCFALSIGRVMHAIKPSPSPNDHQHQIPLNIN